MTFIVWNGHSNTQAPDNVVMRSTQVSDHDVANTVILKPGSEVVNVRVFLIFSSSLKYSMYLVVRW